MVGRLRGICLVAVAVGACGAIAAVSLASAGSRRSNHFCRTATVPVAGKRVHGHPPTRRIRLCIRQVPVHHLRFRIHSHSGAFKPGSLPGVDVPDAGEGVRLHVGPFRPLTQPPTARGIVGVVAPGGAVNAPPPSGPLPVSVAATRLLTPDETAARKNDTFAAQEPSVADAGSVVMYAFNWDAAYSKDGGQTWTELDPHAVFPKDDGGFGCDQVVQYDAMTRVFIWVLQYHCFPGVNMERIAWASATNLVRYGKNAWSWFDLTPRSITGQDNTFLDQPRLGFTPTFLYMSMNQGTTSDSKLQHSVVIRIPRTAFTSTGGSLPVGYALFDPVSLRVAQNVVGPREYFVAHNGTSQLRVAWVDDSSNIIDYQDLNSPTIATDNWTSNTPGGQDMLLHQSSSQGTAVTGVTQGGNGTLWAAWTEARKLPDGTAKYAQPHIGVAELEPIPGHVGFTLLTQHEYDNPSFTYSLPDLATDASGEVGFDVVFGGGGLYYADHAVGLLYPRDHRTNAFEPVADAIGNTDNVQVGSLSGDPAGDYETIRPMAPPYGDCFVAAGVVNQKDSSGNLVGYPVLTIFSRPEVKCPPGFTTLPIVGLPLTIKPPPPPPQTTTVSLNCPTTGTVGSPMDLSGALSPALSGRTITITVGGAASSGFMAVTQSDGTYSSMSYVPSVAGQYTFAASYAGESGYLGSSSPTCTGQVATLPPGATSVSLTCPNSTQFFSPGSTVNLVGQLSPPLSGRKIAMGVTGANPTAELVPTQSDGSFSFSYMPVNSGTDHIVASFGGEPTYLPSSSSPCIVTVQIP